MLKAALLEIIATGGLLHSEALPVSGTAFDSLDRERFERGLIENLMDRIQPFVSIESDTLVDGLRRQRVWRYPAAALPAGRSVPGPNTSHRSARLDITAS